MEGNRERETASQSSKFNIDSKVQAKNQSGLAERKRTEMLTDVKKRK